LKALAATIMEIVADENFGALSRAMLSHSGEGDHFKLYLSHEIKDIDRCKLGG